MAELSNKKNLLLRLQRKNKPLARRVRTISPDLFSLQTGIKKPFVSPESNDYFLRAKNVHSQFTFLNTLNIDDELFSKEIHDVQRMANSLIFSVPDELTTPDEQSLNQINVLLNNNDYGHDSLGKLSRIIGKLVKSNNISAESMQRFLLSANECFSVAEKVMSSFEHTHITPHIRVSEHDNVSGVQIPNAWAGKVSKEQIQRILGIPVSHDMLITSDTFENASVSVFNSKEAPGWILDAIKNNKTPGVELVSDGEKIELSWIDHKETPDDLFNSIRQEGMPSPFDTLIQNLKEFAPSIDTSLTLDQSDIKDYVSMAIAAQSLDKPINLPIGSIALSTDQQWYTRNNNTSTLRSLSDIVNDSSNTTIYPEADSHSGIELPLSALKKLKDNKSVIFAIQPVTNSLRLEVLGVDSTPPSMTWDNPNGKQHQAVALNNQRSTDGRGYIDKVYTTDELNSLNSRSFSDPAGFSNKLKMILTELKADTLADIEIKSNRVLGENRPYYIGVTLYSLTKKGLNVRTVSSLVKDEDSPAPTLPQLKELGLTSADEFLTLASNRDDVDKKLNKALSYNKVKNISLSVRNATHTMGIISKSFPNTKKIVSQASIFDQQQLTKNGRLTHRGDKVLTIDRGNRGLLRASFADTPGSTIGLREKLKNGTGTQLSLDSTSALIVNDSNVYIRDYIQGTTSLIGSVPSVRSLLLSNEKEFGYSNTKSDHVSMLNYAQSKGVISSSSPDDPVVITELCNLPSSTDFSALRSELDQAWSNIVNNYDFSESIETNINKNNISKSLPFNSIIAGGSGGKTGVDFLKTLMRESPALFSAKVQGSGINLESFFSGNLSKVTAAQASLTVADVMKASATLFHIKNPNLVTHHQMSYYVNEILSRLEPSTKVIPNQELKKLCKSFDVPLDYGKKIYNAAYESRKDTLGVNDKFLIDESSFLPFGDGSYLALNAITNSLSTKFNEKQQQKLIIESSLKYTIRDFCRNFTPTNNEHQHVINSDFLTNHKSSVVITRNTNEPLSPELKRDLDLAIGELGKIAYINNGIHNISKPSASINPDLQKSIRELISKNLIDKSSKVEESIARILDESGTLNIKVSPSTSQQRIWLEDALLSSVSNTPTTLAFNDKFTHEQLNEMFEFSEKTLLESPMLYQMSTAQALNFVFDNAKEEYTIANAINDYMKSRPSSFIHARNSVVSQKDFGPLAKERGYSPTLMTPNELVTEVLPLLKERGVSSHTLDDLLKFTTSENRPTERVARATSFFLDRIMRKSPALKSENKLISEFNSSFDVECQYPIATILNKEDFQFLALNITPGNLSPNNEPSNKPSRHK